MGNRDSDSLNNHWRHKARAILPIVNARLDAVTKERDALREPLAKGGFMLTEPHRLDGYTGARKLVIGFENGDDADDAMSALARFKKGGNHEG